MLDLLPSLVNGWHAEPVPIVAAAAAAVLYGCGASVRSGEGRPSRVRVASLSAGIAAILIALLSPIDTLAARYQWMHMVQHLMLLALAPPLVILARPVETASAALAPGLGRWVRTALSPRADSREAAVFGAVAVAILFVGVLWLWHVPALYNATLANDAVHDLEHTAFLVSGLIYWTAVIGRPCWSPDIGRMGRAVLVTAGMVGSWMLAVYIGYAPDPLYAYAGGAGLSAVADQQVAAGMMWVPGSIPFIIALTVLLAGWFDEDARAAAAESSVRA